MEGESTSDNRWWGEFRVPIGQTGRWRIGPLTLWIQRLEGEWRIAHEAGNDPLDETREHLLPVPEDDLLAKTEAVRFGSRGSSESIALGPALADKPVVTRPERPFALQPENEVTIFVSSPLWVQLADASLPDGLLLELPVLRPADTWFGPSTRVGELGYASRSFCRVHLRDVPVHPYQAITAVRVVNKGETILKLERLKIPVANLSIFQSAEGRLWTEAVTLKRSDRQGFAEVGIGERPPSVAGAVSLVAEPRIPATNVVIRAFSSMF